MFDFELPKEVTRIWDLVVPYVQSTNQLDVYINTSIDEPSCYSEICYILSTLTVDETDYFHINTPGGILDSAFQLVDAIKRCRATTVAKLTGTVASAGTIIALSCDELIVAEHTSWMIHNYSAGAYGYEKGHELKARQEHIDKSTNHAFKEFYSGFLTDKEVKEVINGKDIWLTADEVRMRWQRKLDNTTVPRVTDLPPKSKSRSRKSS